MNDGPRDQLDVLDPVGAYTDADTLGHGIELADGNQFRLLNPAPELCNPAVIAHALANLCRFTGHVKEFYSVAEHSIMVSRIVPPHLAMAGLMHDASEAFIGDLSRPLKMVLEDEAPGVIVGIEGRLHAVIAARYGFSWPHDPLVKDADNIALATERRDLMSGNGAEWAGMPDPLPSRIRPLAPLDAAAAFMDRYRELASQDLLSSAWVPDRESATVSLNGTQRSAGVEQRASQTVLEEAQELVYGDRAESYGHPRVHFGRTAAFWTVLFGVDVPIWKVPLAFILDKTARRLNGPKRDHLTDIAGYAATAERLDEPE